MNKPQIIILEGCDKTGKTTLSKELCKMHNLKYVKVSNPKGDPYLEYKKLIDEVKEPTLFDRFHLGETVYGPLMRGKNQLENGKFEIIETSLQLKGAIIIYAYNDKEFIANKFDEDGETFVSKEDIEFILSSYHNILNKSVLPILNYKIGDGYEQFKNLMK